jgi:Uma2 family endonuclease
MAVQPRYGQRWTVEQYLDMERDSPIRHEYIDGTVYAMAGGTRRHNRVSRNATRPLDDQFGDGPCQVYTADMKVRLANERDHAYPDVSVTCDPRDLEDEAPDYISYPRLVIEVLSESTEACDRGAKFDLYRGRDTFQEYVLIETDCSAIEVRSRNDDDSWTTVICGPNDHVALHSIGLTIPVAAFYRGIRF